MTTNAKLYRLIPVSVEAIQITPMTVNEAALWCGGQVITEADALDGSVKFAGLNFPSISGVHRASQGDYLIKNNGAFSVMGEREFHSKYELVD